MAWTATEKFLKRGRPTIVVLENLTALMVETDPGTDPDSEYVCNFLRGLGYSARAPAGEGGGHGRRCGRWRRMEAG